jgi:hypothetical protein
MHGRIFLGAGADPPRTYAFSARDRIDETVQRIRSVRDPRYRYIRNFTAGPTFDSLNRYKEKCFLIMPLMRELYAQGRIFGPPKALMELHGPSEELYDIQSDPHEISNLAGSTRAEHLQALTRMRSALLTWISETGDLGYRSDSPSTLAAAEKEMHDWFGTPAWAQRK